LGKTETLDSLDALAERMLGAYLESPDSRITGTSICIEDVARGVVDDLIPPIEARVDLVYQRQDGALVVRDVKTSRSKWTPDKVAESAPQLHLYAILLNAELEGVGKVQGLEFLTVTKAVKPVVSLHQIAAHPDGRDGDDGHDRHDANDGSNALLGQLRQVWRGISEGVFPARPGWPCKTCPFASQCPASINGGGGLP
jgi:hypothetical protein